MKKAALCLVAIATLAFCADIDKNLLTGKTWKCSQEIENISGHSISEDHSVQFDKNGSYTWSVTTRYIEPKNRFAINFIESGEWKLDGDKLIKRVRSFKASSEDNPEQAAAYEQIARENMKDIKRIRKVELANYTTVLELTSAKMTLKYINAKSPYVCEAQ